MRFFLAPVGSGLAMPAQDPDPTALTEVLVTDGGLTAWDWITAGLVIAGGLALSRVVKALLGRVVRRRADAAVADLIGRLVAYVVAVVAFIYALEQIGVQVGPLLGALGIVGVAVAFALQDILENFVAGLLLQLRRPFSYGDEIVSGDTEGRVQSIDARSVTVLSPDGETIHIPSSQVITDAIVNHTERGARRTTVPVGVAYGTELDRARTALLGAVEHLDSVRDEPPPEVLVVGFGDSSIDLVVRYWHDPTIAAHWQSRNDVALAIDRACREHDIEIPFPQRVVWRAD